MIEWVGRLCGAFQILADILQLPLSEENGHELIAALIPIWLRIASMHWPKGTGLPKP